jgi:hypothetical protein
MKKIAEIIAAIKARTDCRDLAEEIGLPRKWSSFVRNVRYYGRLVCE